MASIRLCGFRGMTRTIAQSVSTVSFTSSGVAVKRSIRSTFYPAWLCVAVAGCATSSPLNVPPPLAVAQGQVLIARLHAQGVQIYQCQPAKNDPTRFDWLFKEPEATLFDHAGRKVGKHFAGPSWEANDGSKVVGEVMARFDSPDTNAIPWLLLRAKSTTGKGRFSTVQSVQRLSTVGGSAPKNGCAQAQLTQELRVPYSADYLFYE
jgi:Protein of unknown function (DUF3455)